MHYPGNRRKKNGKISARKMYKYYYVKPAQGAAYVYGI